MTTTPVSIVSRLARKNILALKPYSSARDEFQGDGEIFLDANENPFPTPYNRYPDPLQRKIKERLSRIKGVDPNSIFLGNGSDEAIDLLIRAFCDPGKDTIIITDPTYGMYAVCADVNAVGIKKVKLTSDFELDTDSISSAIDESTKIIFLCSPNNPTGNLLDRRKILEILQIFSGLVVVDEAYIDFTTNPGFVKDLAHHPNLVILQTFSKAWGLAGLRLGMCFADAEIIALLNKIKYPYNVNIQTQEIALKALENENQKSSWTAAILDERKRLVTALGSIGIVRKIFPSDANFLLVKVDDATKTYDYLVRKGIIVRDRSKVTLCEGCLRITVGTPVENTKLLTALNEL